MSYVSNNCWGFERAGVQANGTRVRPVLPRSAVHGLNRCNSSKSNRSHGVSSNRLCSHKHLCRKVSAAATSEKVKRGRVPSAPQTAAPEDGSGRLADLPLAPVLPAPQLEIPDPDDDDEEPAFELPDEDIRSRGGYTPFEQLQFSDEDVTHELTVHVDAPRSKCFQIWSDRANYLEWFDNIYQLITHKEEINVDSFFVFYQWGTTPMLELYTTLARCEYEQDELIVEENIDGMDMVLGVMFADSETGSGTNVTLRLGYYLPDVLIEFVGPSAIYGDVNDILEASMSRMKGFVETTNLKKLQASRQAERKAAEREQAKRQKQLHKVHGSDEEIYAKAEEAATDYLAQFDDAAEEEEEEDWDEEEEQQDEEEDEQDEDEDYHDDDEEEEEDDYQDEAEEDADISSQDFELSESALSSQLSSPSQTQQLDAQDVPPEPVATTSGSATASEQQAAANMSSSHQQDVGQFDSAQTSRVGEQGFMPVASQSATGESGPLDFEVASASQPASQDADPGEQKKKKPLGRPKKAKPAAEPKAKTPGKPGRPKKSESAATTQQT